MQNAGNKIVKKLLSLELQRKSVKVAMSVTLGILSISALGMKNKKIKLIHTVAGVAMVGLSVWHASLYETRYAKFLNKQSKSAIPKKEKPVSSSLKGPKTKKSATTSQKIRKKPTATRAT